MENGLRSLQGRLAARRGPPPGEERPVPERLERGDLLLLTCLLGIGLVPFERLAVGVHWSAARLLLGGALVLVAGGQLVAEIFRSRPGGGGHGLRVCRGHLVLLRGHLGPGAPVRPPVTGRR